MTDELLLALLPIIQPIRRWPGLPAFTVDKVIYFRKVLASKFRSFQDPTDQLMNRAVRSAVGAHSHADGAVGTGLGPIIETGYFIELPFFDPVDHLFFTVGDRF